MTEITQKRKKQIQEYFQAQRRQQAQQDNQQVLYGEAEGDQLFLTEQQADAVRKSDVRKLSRIEKMFGFRMRGKERMTLTKSVSLFKNSREIQKERRTSDLKKSQRNMIAQELQNTDALRAQQIYTNHQTNNPSLTSDQILENEYMIKMMDGDKKQRQDVTGYERRKHAADVRENNNWEKYTKVMKEDVDNLVENMMKDLTYEAEYEPSEEFAEYREFFRFTRFFEKRLGKLGSEEDQLKKEVDQLDKELDQLKKERDNGTGLLEDEKKQLLEDKKKHLLDTKIKYCRIESLILFVKNVIKGGLQVEYDRKYLKAMKLARKQLLEEEKFESDRENYPRSMIHILEDKINVQKGIIQRDLNSALNPAAAEEADSVARVNIMRQVMHEIGPALKLLMEQIPDKEELGKAMDDVLKNQVEGILVDAGYSLETNQGRKYWNLLKDLKYDDAEIEEKLEEQGTSMEKIIKAENARFAKNAGAAENAGTAD